MIFTENLDLIFKKEITEDFMQFIQFQDYRQWLLLPLTMILIACGNDEPQQLTLKEGLYLPSDISVELIDSQQNQEIQQALKDSILHKINETYFEIQNQHFMIMVPGDDDTALITPENIAISPIAAYYLDPQKENRIKITTQDHPLCKAERCEISLLINPTMETDPKIVALEELDAALYKTLTPITLDIPESYIAKEISKPYYGVKHVLTDHLSIKLTPAESNGFQYGIPDHTTIESFKLGDVLIDPSNELMEIVSFYTNDSPSSEVHQINTLSYIFIMPTKSPLEIDLENLNPEHIRYYKTDNGFVSEDQNGFYNVYYRYMPEIERAIIAVSEGLELQEVLSHYRAFESLKSELIDQESHSDSTQDADTHTADMTALAKKDHSDKIASTKTPSTTVADESIKREIDPYEITLSDYLLPEEVLNERYGITQEQLFRIDYIANNYQNELKRLLTSADLFLFEGPNTTNGYHQFTQYIGDYRFNDTLIKFHRGKLNKVRTHLQESNIENHQAQKDLWENPIYIYSTDSNEASGLSYLKEIQPNVTVEIFTPAHQGHVAEKVLFAKMLTQLPLNDLPELQDEAIQNIGKYHINKTDTEMSKANLTRQVYQFNEGYTNKNGSLFKR